MAQRPLQLACQDCLVAVRQIAILGSTGSIGTQALELISAHPDRFRVSALSAGANVELLARQAVEFGVSVVGCASHAEAVVASAVDAAASEAGKPNPVREIVCGSEAAARIAAMPTDTVLNAITGAAGLTATYASLQAGTDTALANKESLIIGGTMITELAVSTGARLLPVDSEHSALWQALRAGTHREVDRLVLTASGGPFRGMTREQLERVTPQQALKHPTWDMGRVITTNSASLVNKGLEVIEAHLLFDVPYDRIDVVVHPQSNIHSMVQFVDGSTLAQVSPPDMKLPIAYALGYEEHIPAATAPNDWSQPVTWTFEPVDHQAFPALGLAARAGQAGGVHPAWYNASNEVFVDAFHDGHISFTAISDGLAAALDKADQLNADNAVPGGLTLEHVLEADAHARAWAHEWVNA